MIPAGEAVGILELMQYIALRSKHIKRGEIIVHNDNKKIVRKIYREANKESDVTCEAGATIAVI